MENYIKNNTRKKGEKNWNWMLRTVCHVGHFWHHPLRNITIEHWCTLKCCSNHSITIIQNREKRQEQIQKKKIIGNNISDTVFVIIKWKTIKNNTTKKEKRIEIECLRTALHVYFARIVDRPLRKITIERWCPIKRCSNHSITIKHKNNRDKNKYKRKKKIGNNISDIYKFVIIKWKSIMNNTKKKEIKNWYWNVTYCFPCWLRVRHPN